VPIKVLGKERMTPMWKRTFRRIHRWLPAVCLPIWLLTLAAAVCHIVFVCNRSFADWFNENISHACRSFMAHLTGWIPFSLAETIILSLPVTVTVLLVVCIRKANRGKRYMVRVIAGLLAVLAVLYTLFVATFAAGYRGTTVDRKLGLDRQEVSAKELYETAMIVVKRLNILADGVHFVQDTGSVPPYDHAETVALCQDSYEKLAARYDFLPVLRAPVKQITLSSLMTYTHISGMYTYFTGEANLNTNYPYFVNVYTTAHEMAHQRGIARENEANFLAYLVCIGSEDLYMQYCGYLNMYEYLASPLYMASPELYYKAAQSLDSRVRYDLQCYSDFFDKYRDNAAAEVSDAVNNTYLVLQGTAEGTRSYGMVVDLAVAYHLHMEKEYITGGE